MSNSKARRRVQDEIRAAADVLRRDWDPIGAGAIGDLPADEYEAYAPQIVGLIDNGATDQAIAEYLRGLESDTIKMTSGRDLLLIASTLRRAVAAASFRAG